jgi:hypothetical protein
LVAGAAHQPVEQSQQFEVGKKLSSLPDASGKTKPVKEFQLCCFAIKNRTLLAPVLLVV